MPKQDIKSRTQLLAVRVFRLVGMLPRSVPCKIISEQICKSAGSVGANYRSASRARSDAELLSKLGIVVEEADETQYWLELLMMLGAGDQEELQELHAEFDEIVSMMVKARKTLAARKVQASG